MVTLATHWLMVTRRSRGGIRANTDFPQRLVPDRE
jgi:hypothetical protein